MDAAATTTTTSTTSNNQTQQLNELGYMILDGGADTLTLCYFDDVRTDEAFWRSDGALISTLPYFVIQLSVMILCIRLLFFALKPLRQPRFLAELLSGVLLGNTFLGRTVFFNRYIIPAKSLKTMDTMGQLSLVYYMFLVGLEMDLTMLRHVERKATINAALTLVIPMVSGIGLYVFFMNAKDPAAMGIGGIVWAITLTVTSFSDLARILSDMKLLYTDIGRLALSSALICDLGAWILLVSTITIINQHFYYSNVIALVAFVLICWFVVRPAISWVIWHNNSSTGGTDYELLIYFILGAVVIFGLITDACGSQSMVGAFMFGLVIPKGELAYKLIEKLEDMVTGVMLPAFFMSNGLKIHLSYLNKNVSPVIVFLVIILACLSKIIGAFIFSMFQGMPAREGIALGFLMNTKGVMTLIVMNAGRDLPGFDRQMFAIMTTSLILMTIMVKPIALAATQSTKHVKPYKHRTIEQSKNNAELRIISCIHTVSNLSGMINLLEYSNPTKQSPICVFALHLLQLTARRVSAMLIVHDTYNQSPVGGSTHGNQSRESQESENIINSFQAYETRSSFVSVQALTVVSPYNSMHEDVARLAEEKRVNIILVPFHKQPDVYGKFQEDEDSSLRAVNKNLLANAPCSLGILIDRGLGESQEEIHFVMLFIGGPDNREALAYAWRMAETADVMLMVVRFLQTTGGDDDEKEASKEQEIERKLDDEYINDFRFRTMYDESIIYREFSVSSGTEIITTMRTMEDSCDLYIVGKGQGAIPELEMGLLEWSDCEELGALGDTLLSSDFAENSSVLVIQQHYVPPPPPTTTGHKHAHGHSHLNKFHDQPNRPTWQ